MIVTKVAGVTLFVVLVAACSGSSGERAAPEPGLPGTALTDGFVVAPGSRLVGPVFTYPSSQPRGYVSRAVISIDRDPVKVYDEYVVQARHLGIPLPGSGTSFDEACRRIPHYRPGSPGMLPLESTVPAAAVTCGGGIYSAADRSQSVSVEVTWGGASRYAVLSVTPVAFPFVRPDLGDARAPAVKRLPKISDADLASEAGSAFGPSNNAFDAADYHRFKLEPGSRVVADDGSITVLAIDGNAERVMEGYAAQLGGKETPSAVRSERARAGAVLLVENSPTGGGAATFLTDPSGKWLLMEVNSD